MHGPVVAALVILLALSLFGFTLYGVTAGSAAAGCHPSIGDVVAR